MDKAYLGSESQVRAAYGDLRAGSIQNAAASQAVRLTELEAIHDRLKTIQSRLWKANEEMFATADRISGGSLESANKGVAPPPQRGGLIGFIEKTIESMEEAASALEDRATYFSRLG